MLKFVTERLSQHTPTLPDARPRSDRPRCAGRESKFLAVKPKKPRQEFKAFATDLCKLPESIWKKGIRAKNCVDQVLAEMENLKLFQLPGEG